MISSKSHFSNLQRIQSRKILYLLTYFRCHKHDFFLTKIIHKSNHENLKKLQDSILRNGNKKMLIQIERVQKQQMKITFKSHFGSHALHILSQQILIQQSQIMKPNYILDFSNEALDLQELKPKYSHNKPFPMIKGVAIIVSDSEGQEDETQQILLIKNRLEEFKKFKAREVLAEHKRTKVSIDNIIAQMKKQIQQQALRIIHLNTKENISSQQKSRKEERSTLPSTNCKNKTKNDDLEFSSRSKKQWKSKGFKQFTLGNKNRFYSTQNNKENSDRECQVSQFQVQEKQTKNTSKQQTLQLLN